MRFNLSQYLDIHRNGLINLRNRKPNTMSSSQQITLSQNQA